MCWKMCSGFRSTASVSIALLPIPSLSAAQKKSPAAKRYPQTIRKKWNDRITAIACHLSAEAAYLLRATTCCITMLWNTLAPIGASLRIPSGRLRIFSTRFSYDCAECKPAKRWPWRYFNARRSEGKCGAVPFTMRSLWTPGGIVRPAGEKRKILSGMQRGCRHVNPIDDGDRRRNELRGRNRGPGIRICAARKAASGESAVAINRTDSVSAINVDGTVAAPAEKRKASRARLRLRPVPPSS